MRRAFSSCLTCKGSAEEIRSRLCWSNLGYCCPAKEEDGEKGKEDTPRMYSVYDGGE